MATDTDQNSLNWQQESVSGGKPVAMVTTEHQSCSGKSQIPEESGEAKPKNRIWPHHFHISPDYVPHMEQVFSIVRKIYDRKPTDDMKDLDAKTAIWVFSCLSHFMLQFILDRIIQ